jgi:hypothetical protein
MPTNEQKIEVLKALRESCTYFYGLCAGLNIIRYRNPLLWRATIDLRNYVMDALAPAITLEEWQQKRGIHHTRLQLYEDRLAWIDWMIAQLQEQE